MALQLVLSMAMTNLTIHFEFGRRITDDVFIKINAKKAILKHDKINQHKRGIAARHPNLNNVLAINDGVKIVVLIIIISQILSVSVMME